MKDKIIGIADISYEPDGTINSASFTPTMFLDLKDDGLMHLLSSVKQGSADEIKNNAEIIMASWFSKLTEIELADRTTHEIKGEVLECEKYDNGNTKHCKVKFIFKQFN